MKFKEKIALGIFMESVPRIIELWKRSAPNDTLDTFLLRAYEDFKRKKEVKK